MNLANDGIAAQAVTKQSCDLARALALNPMLPKLLHSFIRPGHGRLARQFFRLERYGWRRIPFRAQGSIPSGKTPTIHLLKRSPRHLVAIEEKTTLLVELCARVRDTPSPGFSTGLGAAAISAHSQFDCLRPIRGSVDRRSRCEPHTGFSFEVRLTHGRLTRSGRFRYILRTASRPSGAAFFFTSAGGGLGKAATNADRELDR